MIYRQIKETSTTGEEDDIKYYNEDHELIHLPTYLAEIAEELFWLKGIGVLSSYSIVFQTDHPVFGDMTWNDIPGFNQPDLDKHKESQ